MKSNLELPPPLTDGVEWGCAHQEGENAHHEDRLRPFHEFIGSALKVVRVHRGLRQEDVASAIGKTRDYVCMVENNNSGLGLEQLDLFCRALTCPASRVVACAEDLALQDSRRDADVIAELKRVTRDRLEKKGFLSRDL